MFTEGLEGVEELGAPRFVVLQRAEIIRPYVGFRRRQHLLLPADLGLRRDAVALILVAGWEGHAQSYNRRIYAGRGIGQLGSLIAVGDVEIGAGGYVLKPYI